MAPRIALLGCEGSFHHQAALRHFGSALEPVWCATFAELAAAAADPSRSDGGIMAIHNAQAGPLAAALEAIAAHPLHTVNTLELPVRLHLAVHPTADAAAIREVHSHPVALQTCAGLLGQHPEWQQVIAASTANAAALAAARPGIAAICGADAVARFGLRVHLAEVDPPGNFTRFAVLVPSVSHTKSTI